MLQHHHHAGEVPVVTQAVKLRLGLGIAYLFCLNH